MKLRKRNKARLTQRRAAAVERQTVHATLTPQQKVAKLDERLGMGVGATRERARILKQVSQPVVVPEAMALSETTKERGPKRGRKSHGHAPTAPTNP